MPFKDPEVKKEWDRQHYILHREENQERNRKHCLKYYYNHWEERLRYSKTHREHIRQINRELTKRLKVEVLAHYGGGVLACVKCGKAQLPCLSLDHINGNGNRHRRELGASGVYRWAKKNHYPGGYQTLCMNCQFIKKDKRRENRWELSKIT